MTTRSRLWRAAAALTTLATLTTACGDDDDASTDDTVAADDSTTSTTEAPGVPTGTIEVTAVDYGYEGLADEIGAGSTLTLTNASEVEVHELVAFFVPEGEERSPQELFALSDEELGVVTGGPPVAVLVALPGEDGQPVFGSGALTVPGRYVYGCFIPVGTDPAIYEAAIASGQEPDLPEGGVPHIDEGMLGEVRVS